MWDILKRIWETICFWRDKRKEKEPDTLPEPDAFEDELDTAAVSVHGIDWRAWLAKYDLKVTHSGSGVYLEQQLTSELDSIDDNVGSCWFIVRGHDQKWRANRWDQIRGGQKKRDFPWNPPHPKEGENYATAKRHQEVYVCVTSMARDHKRNGDVRTKIARLQ